MHHNAARPHTPLAGTAGLMILLALVTSPAEGQHALGDGTALDRNLQVGGPGVNRPVRDLVSEIRFRNAIVTGNAPGGLSFRGDLGYTAADEFRNPIGSNDIYLFRRDSLYSGLAGMGIRGTEALQQQFGLLTGNRLPDQLTGSMVLPRAGGLAGPAPIARIDPLDPLADDRGAGLWTLRSTAAAASTLPFEPTMLESRVSQTGELIGFVASGLRGVRVMPIGRAGTLPQGPQRARATYNPLEEVAERLDAFEMQGAPAPVEAPTWRRGMEQIQELLRQWDEMDEAKQTPDAVRPMIDPQLPRADRPGEPQGGAGRFDPEIFRTLRDGAGRIESLATPSADDPLLAGQNKLRQGRYFEAEELFTRAMASNVGGALAAVGRVHAQLAAGVYTSAAINLRTLLRDHPELVGVRYGDAALPPKDRLAAVRSDLSQRVARGGRLAPDWGLLLAYIGFQTGDDETIKTGINAMRIQEGDPLIDLLIGVWSPPGD